MSKHIISSATLYQLFKSPQLNTAIDLLGHTGSSTLKLEHNVCPHAAKKSQILKTFQFSSDLKIMYLDPEIVL